jgi:hypothetical protein
MSREDFAEGYRMGYQDARLAFIAGELDESLGPRMKTVTKKNIKRKVKQSPKQKLLSAMSKKKWDKYKKGKGKKTYVQIRAEVSRSQEFKRKAKRL